ncbi:unnamed protein product [Ceutorhynchus assimilis]|uniref:Uncharacterized protein n=1 Tax=Ceutorhynchus assimilis TaxID=467358 RepID=A0A9N9QJF5_9CUCU|nr:unnamed protein product [Ceutorhynchus assimilis]
MKCIEFSDCGCFCQQLINVLKATARSIESTSEYLGQPKKRISPQVSGRPVESASAVKSTVTTWKAARSGSDLSPSSIFRCLP